MEKGASTGEGGGLDLSALLGSLQGSKESGGVDLSALLGMLGAGDRGEKSQGEGGGADLASLLGMLGGIGGAGEEKEPPPPPRPEPQGQGPALDPALFSTLTRAMSALREPDRNIRLLESLRPFLEEERQKKADEAVKLLHLMRLAPLLQESGILRQLTGG